MEKIERSKNYNGKLFMNSVPTTISKERTMWNSMWRWITSKNIREPEEKYVFKANPALLKNSDNKNSLKIIWIGHSTLLIMIDGKVFLTDPVWRKYASPVQFAGPARFHNPPLSLEDIPKIDAVILSHNHYDHFDSSTIKILSKRGITFYTPLGLGEHLRSLGISDNQIHELDWWDSITVGDGFTIAATPARHFSNRGLFDRNKTLWASWVIIGPKHRIFYGADGGLFSGFKDIGNKYGPFDITFLEIGAYDVNWPNIHLGPENALIAHHDLKGRLLIPIHWGTFNLAIHPWIEPAEKITALAQKNNIKITIPEPGQIVDYSKKPFISYWWDQSKKN